MNWLWKSPVIFLFMPGHPAVGNPSPPMFKWGCLCRRQKFSCYFPCPQRSLQKISPGLSDTSPVHVIRQDREKDMQILRSVLSWLSIAFPHSYWHSVTILDTVLGAYPSSESDDAVQNQPNLLGLIMKWKIRFAAWNDEGDWPYLDKDILTVKIHPWPLKVHFIHYKCYS